MRLSHTDMMIMEAFLDGELAGEELSKAESLLKNHPELKMFYNILKAQKKAVKCAFLSDENTH